MKRLTTEEELSGLLNLALEGLKRLLERGDFSRSLSTEEAREQYIKMSDSLAAFVQECVEEAPDAWISKDEFYAAYTAYCRQNKLPIISKGVVGRRLPQLCRVESYRPKVAGVRITAWKGIRLKKQEEEEEEEQEYVTIRLTRIPQQHEILGVDGQVYRLEREGQLLRLPKQNARILIERGYAVEEPEEER